MNGDVSMGKWRGWLAAGLLLWAAPAWADDFTYVTNADDTITVAGYSGGESFVIVPVAVDGKPVTVIGDGAFYENALSGISLPDTVTNVGADAFSHCGALNDIAFPTGVVRIGAGAFTLCSQLNHVFIPNGVTRIEDDSFLACSHLSELVLSTNVAQIGAQAFYGCVSLEFLEMPASLEDVGAYAFFGCTNLGGVYFRGEAPAAGDEIYSNAAQVVSYYLEGMAGWTDTFGGRPTAVWVPADDFLWELNGDNTVRITGYTGPGGVVGIPGIISNRSVTVI